MNDIKYKLWDKIDKRMLEIVGFCFETPTILRFWYWQNDRLLNESIAKQNAELLPLTCFKDKNGKDIYDGDIIHFNTSYENSNDDYDYSTEPARVQWSESVAGFWPFCLNSRWRCDVENVEIIGNIYENPELIPQLQTAR